MRQQRRGHPGQVPAARIPQALQALQQAPMVRSPLEQIGNNQSPLAAIGGSYGRYFMKLVEPVVEQS